MAAGIKVLAAITVGTAAASLGTATVASLYVQADVGNAAKVLYIGDSSLTGGNSNYSVALSAGQSWTYNIPEASRPGFSQLDLAKFFIACGVAGGVAHVSYLERGG